MNARCVSRVPWLSAREHARAHRQDRRADRRRDARNGLEVDLRDVDHAADAKPGRYDLVVGGSLHREHHQKELAAWVSERRDALAAVPSAFLSVSLSAAEGTPARPVVAR